MNWTTEHRPRISCEGERVARIDLPGSERFLTGRPGSRNRSGPSITTASIPAKIEDLRSEE